MRLRASFSWCLLESVVSGFAVPSRNANRLRANCRGDGPRGAALEAVDRPAQLEAAARPRASARAACARRCRAGRRRSAASTSPWVWAGSSSSVGERRHRGQAAGTLRREPVAVVEQRRAEADRDGQRVGAVDRPRACPSRASARRPRTRDQALAAGQDRGPRCDSACSALRQRAAVRGDASSATNVACAGGGRDDRRPGGGPSNGTRCSARRPLGARRRRPRCRVGGGAPADRRASPPPPSGQQRAVEEAAAVDRAHPVLAIVGIAGRVVVSSVPGIRCRRLERATPSCRRAARARRVVSWFERRQPPWWARADRVEHAPQRDRPVWTGPSVSSGPEQRAQRADHLLGSRPARRPSRARPRRSTARRRRSGSRAGRPRGSRGRGSRSRAGRSRPWASPAQPADVALRAASRRRDQRATRLAGPQPELDPVQAGEVGRGAGASASVDPPSSVAEQRRRRRRAAGSRRRRRASASARPSRSPERDRRASARRRGDDASPGPPRRRGTRDRAVERAAGSGDQVGDARSAERCPVCTVERSAAECRPTPRDVPGAAVGAVDVPRRRDAERRRGVDRAATGSARATARSPPASSAPRASRRRAGRRTRPGVSRPSGWPCGG